MDTTNTREHTRALNRKNKWKLMGKWTSTSKETEPYSEQRESVDDLVSWKTTNRMPHSKEQLFVHCINHHQKYENRGNYGKMKERGATYNKVPVLKTKLGQLADEEVNQYNDERGCPACSSHE